MKEGSLMSDKNCTVIKGGYGSTLNILIPCGTEVTVYEAFIKPLPTVTISIDNFGSPIPGEQIMCELELIVKLSDGSVKRNKVNRSSFLLVIAESVKNIKLKCIGETTEPSFCEVKVQIQLTYCQCCKD
jgi:hypothetical protein